MFKSFLGNSFFPFEKYSMCPGDLRTSQTFWGGILLALCILNAAECS